MTKSRSMRRTGLVMIAAAFAVNVVWTGMMAIAEDAEPELKPNMPEDVQPRVPQSPTTGTPTPTPTPPPACPYYKGTMSYTGWDDPHSNTTPFAGSDTTNTCVRQWIQQIGSSCSRSNVYCDDTKARDLARLVFGGKQTVTTTMSAFPNDHSVLHYNQTTSTGAYCNDLAVHHFDGGWVQSVNYPNWTLQLNCISGHFYFDSNCNIVGADEVLNACGSEPPEALTLSYIKSSPISLLWTEDADIERSAVASTFPLNPGEKGKWYAWRASAQAPLLVYDPSHTGQVSSAHQLFGNWTFGGQRTATLNSTAAKPWSDGYEALATLDHDRDGKLSGRELKPLALWFDRNQDAIVQEGELLRADEAGLKAVYTEPDNRDSGAQHIVAARGFEREDKGRIVSGASVDWFAESAASPFAITAGLAMSKAVEAAAAPAPAIEIKAARENGRSVAGVWQWRFDDLRDVAAYDGRTEGMFVFSKAEGTTELEGYSVVLSAFEKTPNNIAAGKGQVYFFRGSNEGSKVKFAFRERYAQMNTDAELSADGTMLKGVSTAIFDDNGGLKRLTYHWTARRAD